MPRKIIVERTLPDPPEDFNAIVHAVRESIAKVGQRETARRIGVSPWTLVGLLADAVPREPTLKRIRDWMNA